MEFCILRFSWIWHWQEFILTFCYCGRLMEMVGISEACHASMHCIKISTGFYYLYTLVSFWGTDREWTTCSLFMISICVHLKTGGRFESSRSFLFNRRHACHFCRVLSSHGFLLSPESVPPSM